MATQVVLWTMVMTMAWHYVVAHREHKVHNIVLYPDKYSWCNITPIKQVVAYPDCTSVEIDNNVCVGTCFSYSIPLTLPSAPGEIIEPYCDSCQPSSIVWQNFTLTCQEKTMQKTVQIIQNCSCNTCHKGNEELDLSSNNDHEHPSVDGRKILDSMVENAESRATDTEHEESDEKERVFLIEKNLDSGEETEEIEKKDLMIEPDGKYLLSDKEAIVNFFQEADNPAYTTEQKLQYLCRYIKGKETLKPGDTIKHNKSEKSEHHHIGNQATRHHHGHHSGTHHQHIKTDDDGSIGTEHTPTLDLSPGQVSPAKDGEEFTYIPNNGQANENIGKGD